MSRDTTITTRCILWRHGLPPAAYSSTSFRALCRTLDEAALLLTVLNNALQVMVRQRKAAASAASPLPTTLVYGIALATVAYNVGLVLASRRWPETYFRHRHLFLLGSRLIRATSLAEWMHYMRTWFATPATARAMVAAYAGVDTASATPRLSSAFSSVLGFSGVLHAIAHTATVPLPLLLQAACLTVYTAVLLLLQAPLATASLALSPHSQKMQGACQGLSNAAMLLATAHCGTLPDLDAVRAVCTDHSAMLLVVAAQLYFGFMVPLYCSYRLERGLHLLYNMQYSEAPPAAQAPGPATPSPGHPRLHTRTHAHADAPVPPGAPPDAPPAAARQGEGMWSCLVGDGVLLALLLAWSWLLAVAGHKHLLRLWLLLGWP